MQHRKLKTEQTVRTEGLSRAGKPGSKKLTKPLTFVGMIHVKIIHRCDQDPADADAAVALLDLRSDPIKHERESSSSSSGSPPNALWVEFPAFRKDTLMEDEQKPQICPEKEPPTPAPPLPVQTFTLGHTAAAAARANIYRKENIQSGV